MIEKITSKLLQSNRIESSHIGNKVSNWESKNSEFSLFKEAFVEKYHHHSTSSVHMGCCWRCWQGYFSLAASHWPCLSHLDLSHNGRLVVRVVRGPRLWNGHHEQNGYKMDPVTSSKCFLLLTPIKEFFFSPQLETYLFQAIYRGYILKTPCIKCDPGGPLCRRQPARFWTTFQVSRID